MVKNTEGDVDGDKLLGRMMKSFHRSKDSDIRAFSINAYASDASEQAMFLVPLSCAESSL